MGVAAALWPDGVFPAGPAPCRLCGQPAYLQDEEGPLHVCCLANAARFARGLGCPACRAAERLARRDVDYTAFDRRAIASGRRRSSPAAYRQARAEMREAR